jgi:hypothetical protein
MQRADVKCLHCHASTNDVCTGGGGGGHGPGHVHGPGGGARGMYLGHGPVLPAVCLPICLF